MNGLHFSGVGGSHGATFDLVGTRELDCVSILLKRDDAIAVTVVLSTRQDIDLWVMYPTIIKETTVPV